MTDSPRKLPAPVLRGDLDHVRNKLIRTVHVVLTFSERTIADKWTMHVCRCCLTRFIGKTDFPVPDHVCAAYPERVPEEEIERCLSEFAKDFEGHAQKLYDDPGLWIEMKSDRSREILYSGQ